jgi:hypothetical protein
VPSTGWHGVRDIAWRQGVPVIEAQHPLVCAGIAAIMMRMSISWHGVKDIAARQDVPVIEAGHGLACAGIAAILMRVGTQRHARYQSEDDDDQGGWSFHTVFPSRP